jgi:hypothetical protein
MWVYKGAQVNGHDDLRPGCTDFVYIIHYVGGKKYIGKKTVRSVRKKPPLAGKKRSRRIMTDLPFVKYEGSPMGSCSLQIDRKEILYQCRGKKAATYLEAALLFYYDAIFNPEYLNENIIGKFYDNDLNGLIEDEDVELPVDYTNLSPAERRKIRMQYIREQNCRCYKCKADLRGDPAADVLELEIDKSLFPENFFKHPIHLHHDHSTDLTIGAVHAHCNAVLWQYDRE